MGNGENNFIATAPSKNGFHVPFDSRSITLIKGKDKNYILISDWSEIDEFYKTAYF